MPSSGPEDGSTARPRWDAEFYDREAPTYDDTRGGAERAGNAVAAILRLVRPPGVLVDVAGGTGIVSAGLATAGFEVVVLDRSGGMLRVADRRLPGRAVQGSAERIAVATGSVDVVTTVWLLHLLGVTTADRVVAEAARVLRPGGRWLTTVDKSQAHGHPAHESDDRDRVVAVAAAAGLARCGSTSFTGPSDFGSATEDDPCFPLVAFERGR